MKHGTLFILALLAMAGSSFSKSYGQNAVAIATEYENKKIEAIAAYIASNPNAPDLDQAYSILVGAYVTMNNMDKVLETLEKRYELAPKGKKAILGSLIGDIGRPFIDICVQVGQKDRGKAFVKKMKTDLADHPEASQINGFIDQIAADLYIPGIGDTMDISFTATNGQKVDVAEMRGKVILIDFWASWCAPCIEEMPTVIAAFNTYHEKGFEVIGISLDENLAALEDFMAANGVLWPQYFDGKSWGNEIAGEYGIKGIPATFLIGKEGKIIANDLRGPELEAAIRKELGLPELKPEAP